MKVLFISTLWPSQEFPQYVIFCEQLAKALIHAGVDVDVVIPSKDEKVYSRNGIKIINLEASKLKEKLNELVLKEQYDVIHTHFVGNFKMCSIIKSVCKKNNIPFVYHKHGLNVLREYFEKYPLYEKYLSIRKKRMYKKTDVVIGVSDKVSQLVKTLVGKKEVYTIYNGVDINKFVPTEKKDNDVVKIICVGNLIKIKGQDYLIRACRKLCDEGITNFHLTLLGRGVEEENLKKLVCDLGLDEFVDFGGYIEYEQVVEKMQESDIFILPSYFEALGCVYLEAMGCKLCTIGCRNQGIDEIIVHGENGLLVNERDVASITECLKLVITDKKKRSELAENGYKTIQKYTWAKSAEELIKVYNKTLKIK